MSDTALAPRSAGMIQFLERIVRDPSIEVAKLRELLELQRSVHLDHSRQAFNAAMSSVQEEIGQIIRCGQNPVLHNAYARLEDLDKAARPIYSKHGFSVRYGSAKPSQEGWLRITLTIAHRDGYSEEHFLEGPIDIQTASNGSGRVGRRPIQAVGSTVTFLRRYLLQMVINLVPADNPDDDDGEGGRGPTTPRRSPPPPPPPAREAAPKRRTVSEWLDNLENELSMALSSEEVDHILAGREVQEAQIKLTNGAKDRLDTMIRDALDRFRSDDINPEDRLEA